MKRINKLSILCLLATLFVSCGETPTSVPSVPPSNDEPVVTTTQTPTTAKPTTVTPTTAKPTTVTPTTAKPTTVTPTTVTPTTLKPTEASKYLVGYSTKNYNVGDQIDKAAFKVELVNNGQKSSVSDFEVTLNEESASLTSKATIKASGLETIVAIPLKTVRIEAENCTNTTDNYRLNAKEGTYMLEEGYGENGSGTFGTFSRTRTSKSNPGVDTEMTFIIDSGMEQKVSLFMNASSTKSISSKMKDVLVEDAFDMTFNGEAKAFIENATVLGEDSSSWFNWKYLEIATFDLKAGINTIEFKMNYQGALLSPAQTNGNGPFNIDYFVFQYNA